MYFGWKTISALVFDFERLADYSIDWLISVGFRQQEIDIILEKTGKLRDKYNIPFSCVIWSPAVEFAEEIVHDLGYYGKVLSVKKYQYNSKDEYLNTVRAIYAIDDIEKWKIEKKLEHMEGYVSELVVVDFQMDDPIFKVKSATKKPLSQRGERAKRAVRLRYRERVENYFYDIIIHIADNYIQSEYIKCIFEPDIDFKEVLAILNAYRYALIKVDGPFMPQSFPERIPVGRDIDILCAREDINNIKEQIKEYSRRYGEYEVVICDSPNRLHLRFELSGNLIFQIDCFCDYGSIPEEFLKIALQSRVLNEKGYYVLDIAFEAIIRKVIFEENKSKDYYSDYFGKYKIDIYMNRYQKQDEGETDDLFSEFRQYLYEKEIPYESVCIVGSIVLDILGVRKANDLDFIVLSKYADKFSNKAIKVTKSKKIERVKKNWLSNGNILIYSDDEIIESSYLHFYYQGFKIVKMPLVVYKKSIMRREKDLKDLELISEKWLNA